MVVGSPDWNRLIIDGARKFEFEIDATMIGQFAVHAQELLVWTRRTNLTTITDPAEMAVKHFLDSIIPAKYVRPDQRLLDVGSGGGFPGIPLKVVVPSLSVTLVDSVRKKVSFLSHVIRRMKLQQIVAVNIRLENFRPERKFDLIISRAFSSLEKFVTFALPLLAKDGLLVALKGRFDETEAQYETFLKNQRQNLPEEIRMSLKADFKTYLLPFFEAERTLVIIKNPYRGL